MSHFTHGARSTAAFQRWCRGVRCDENPIYVFPERNCVASVPNFHIHVSVSDLYNPRIEPLISLQQNRQADRGKI